MKFVLFFSALLISITGLAEERDFNGATLIEKQSDGTYKVTCEDTSVETVKQFDVLDGNICPYVPFVREKQDILFVVDDSGSMHSHQQKLSSHAGLILEKLKLRGIDYRIAVSTTSEYHTLKGLNEPSGERFITPQTPNAKEALEKNLLVGTNGQPNEESLTSPILILKNQPDFKRPNSNVHVVFFTDEDDQSFLSVESFMVTMDKLTGSFEQTKKYEVTLIGVLDDECRRKAQGFEPVATKLLALTQEVTSNSICIADPVYSIF